MSHTKPLPELPDVQVFQNTDREVWRETPGDFYSNSVHLTATGGLGINVGGTVYVKPPAEWHRLASVARSTAAQPVEPIPEVLFDTYAVLQAMSKQAKERTGPVSVGDVLDAVVDLLRAAPPAASGDSTPPSIKFEINKDFPCSLPTGPRDVLATIELALTRGYAPSDILDENSPIRDRIRAELAAPVQGDPSGALRPEPGSRGD